MNLLSFFRGKFGRKPERLQRRTYKSGAADPYDVNWTTSPVSIDQVIYDRLQVMQARSVEQATNNEYARKFLLMLKHHVIGAEGITLQMKTDSEAFNDEVESAWRDWVTRADWRGAMTLHDIAKLSLTNMATYGETIVRKYYQRGEFYLDLVETPRLPIRLHRQMEGRREIQFGIEYSRDRPVMYYLGDAEAMEGYLSPPNYGQNPYRQLEGVSADNILHLFIAEHVGQKRGIPWFAVPLRSMRQLTAYSDAALINARESASKQGFISMADPTQMPADFVNQAGEKFSDSEPGEWHILPENAQVHSYDPQYPNNEYDSFHKSMLRRVASGLGAAYNTLANDLEGVNFSSMRHGVIEEREVYKDLQEQMINRFYTPIFRAWYDRQALAGRWPEQLPALKWRPRRWAWVDPVSEARANEIGVRLGWQTVSQVIRESGREPAEVMAERAADLQAMEQAGYPADLEIMNTEDTSDDSRTAATIPNIRHARR